MGRDACTLPPPGRSDDFNPLSPHGERLAIIDQGAAAPTISIHSPRMGRDCIAAPCGRQEGEYFNPLSPHGERQIPFHHLKGDVGISIHSPRMGRDNFLNEKVNPKCISIHSPRMGRDKPRKPCWAGIWVFQSTLPAWGETTGNGRRTAILHRISIHSPRMGRDRGYLPTDGERAFQSTLPAWGETPAEVK